jgi:hypothetical protein
MLLRVIRGRVATGRESEFLDICRRQVAERGRAPGLVAFFPGYRRVGGTEQFLLAATWQSDDDAVRSAGPAQNPSVVSVLGEVATVDSFEQFEVVGPTFSGLVDAPGGVVRLTSAFIKPGRRDDLYAWLAGRNRTATSQAQRLLLGWAIGERSLGERRQVISVSVWPSPLVIEALSEPGREGTSLFSAADEFVEETAAEQYQAISLELPHELADIGARRILAARFATREPADQASLALVNSIRSAAEVPISIAPLGAPGTARDVQSWILVARVSAA